MSFNPDTCIIRKLYCGNGNIPTNTFNSTHKYSKRGTPYQCLQKGIGMGVWTERHKQLFSESLLNITYVSETIEQNFKKENIETISQLLQKINSLNSQQINRLLNKICKEKGTINHKAKNTILLFLYNQNIQNLPSCKFIKE